MDTVATADGPRRSPPGRKDGGMVGSDVGTVGRWNRRIMGGLGGGTVGRWDGEVVGRWDGEAVGRWDRMLGR